MQGKCVPTLQVITSDGDDYRFPATNVVDVNFIPEMNLFIIKMDNDDNLTFNLDYVISVSVLSGRPTIKDRDIPRRRGIGRYGL